MPTCISSIVLTCSLYYDEKWLDNCLCLLNWGKVRKIDEDLERIYTSLYIITEEEGDEWKAFFFTIQRVASCLPAPSPSQPISQSIPASPHQWEWLQLLGQTHLALEEQFSSYHRPRQLAACLLFIFFFLFFFFLFFLNQTFNIPKISQIKKK